MSGTKILCIPDAHADPDYDNDRFLALGRFVLDERPDVIICLGDWADMKSLSSYDKGTKGFEGRRYTKDVAAARDALRLFHSSLDDYNAKRRSRKKATYSPRLVVTLGNHEDRIDRAVNAQAELDGTISTDQLGFEQHGWEVYPFKEIVDVEGFSVSHYFASGVLGRPVGGTSPARSLLQKLHTSAIAGHSHLFDVHVDTRPDGRKIVGLVGGSFCHPDFVEGWSAGTAHMWSAGVSVLDGASDGYFEEFRFVTRDSITRRYL